jgi:hypothetical protein
VSAVTTCSTVLFTRPCILLLALSCVPHPSCAEPSPPSVETKQQLADASEAICCSLSSAILLQAQRIDATMQINPQAFQGKCEFCALSTGPARQLGSLCRGQEPYRSSCQKQPCVCPGPRCRGSVSFAAGYHTLHCCRFSHSSSRCGQQGIHSCEVPARHVGNVNTPNPCVSTPSLGPVQITTMATTRATLVGSSAGVREPQRRKSQQQGRQL